MNSTTPSQKRERDIHSECGLKKKDGQTDERTTRTKTNQKKNNCCQKLENNLNNQPNSMPQE